MQDELGTPAVGQHQLQQERRCELSALRRLNPHARKARRRLPRHKRRCRFTIHLLLDRHKPARRKVRVQR